MEVLISKNTNIWEFSIFDSSGGLGMKQADVHAVSAVGTYKAEVLQCSALMSTWKMEVLMGKP